MLLISLEQLEAHVQAGHAVSICINISDRQHVDVIVSQAQAERIVQVIQESGQWQVSGKVVSLAPGPTTIKLCDWNLRYE